MAYPASSVVAALVTLLLTVGVIPSTAAEEELEAPLELEVRRQGADLEVSFHLLESLPESFPRAPRSASSTR